MLKDDITLEEAKVAETNFLVVMVQKVYQPHDALCMAFSSMQMAAV